MKIQYQDYGAAANIEITSTVFEFRKHNRVVDATLLCTPGIIASRAALLQSDNDITNGKPLTITLPALPIQGSKEEWYQGFAAGTGSMREECDAALISARIGVEVK